MYFWSSATSQTSSAICAHTDSQALVFDIIVDNSVRAWSTFWRPIQMNCSQDDSPYMANLCVPVPAGIDVLGHSGMSQVACVPREYWYIRWLRVPQVMIFSVYGRTDGVQYIYIYIYEYI